jgi:glycerol-3-phosphate acyltransferase PlsY
MNALYFLLAALIGYLCGSVPFGYIYVRLFKGEDLTQIGSGRTGGTNSFRAAGLGVGVLTSVSDVFKGAMGLLIPTWLFGDALGPALLPWAQALAGVMAVVGHNWSIFLRFKGGAGTGPNVGWGSAIWWPIFPIAFLVMGGLLWLIGMASIASLAMAGVLIVVFAIRYVTGIDPTIAYLTGSLVSAAVITFALRPNIRRVLNGTERRVGPAARRAEANARKSGG